MRIQTFLSMSTSYFPLRWWVEFAAEWWECIWHHLIILKIITSHHHHVLARSATQELRGLCLCSINKVLRCSRPEATVEASLIKKSVGPLANLQIRWIIFKIPKRTQESVKSWYFTRKTKKTDTLFGQLPCILYHSVNLISCDSSVVRLTNLPNLPSFLPSSAWSCVRRSSKGILSVTCAGCHAAASPRCQSKKVEGALPYFFSSLKKCHPCNSSLFSSQESLQSKKSSDLNDLHGSSHHCRAEWCQGMIFL